MKKAQELRSQRWFSRDDLRSFGHRSRLKQMGYWSDEFVGKPIIAIINTWSDLNTCQSHFPERVKDIKRGIQLAGGFAVELPAMSTGEQLMKPSAMMYRNLLAMQTEELLRSYPVDGAVLMGGCDKTTPGLLMGAISCNIPSIYFPAGAMLRGNFRGQAIGSGTDVWKFNDQRRAGLIGKAEWESIENGIARSAGTCMTMGTAATLMSITDSLGMTLPGASSIPAVDANHQRLASATGQTAVQMVWHDRTPETIITEKSIHNAIVTHMALGGSTNAIIHIIAIARRMGIALSLKKFDEIAMDIPLLVNLKPAGEYLMEDFYYAGGLCALLNKLQAKLHLECQTVNGKILKQNIQDAVVYLDDVIRDFGKPVQQQGSTAVLFGNIAMKGAVIKPTAMAKKFKKHTGRAVVFSHIAELKQHIDDEDLEITQDDILILKNAGPIGGPGMPEWGMLPIPKKLLKQGVTDMLRISDARMSGTSYGACILHVSPEAAVGGAFAVVETGDKIQVDVEQRRLNVLLSDTEIQRRLANWQPPRPAYQAGYVKLYTEHVNQAHLGCDFDFMSTSPHYLDEPDIY